MCPVPHQIEVFTADCPLCKTTLAVVESGKCGSCVMVEGNLARGSDNEPLTAKYGIRVVPTIVIDGRIKVEGLPDFPWVCGDDFYAMLESRFPLEHEE